MYLLIDIRGYVWE